MRRSLRRTFFRPERPTLTSRTSRSLQSITRPFQKRFGEVFGNARILIFYLSIKAGEEKSLPKFHLGWFFLVFGEGKATKENMSIFWFIWPLKPHFYEKCKKIRNPTTDFSITSALNSLTSLHEKNSGETIRRFRTIIQSIFCAQSGTGISLNFWK